MCPEAASLSVIIPAREWDRHLENTLRSIAVQRLDADVVLEVVVALAGPPPDEVPPGVTILPNPTGTIPDGLNLAIAASSGDLIVRVDSRCDLPPHYLGTVREHLEDPSIGCVGGAQLVLDRGLFGSAYAVAFNSALLGPSTYRYRRTSGPISSPYLGAWRRRDLIEVGCFDPALLRNQDNELSDRVLRSGKQVWYDADLVVGYFNSRNLPAAIAHHHEFGLWRMVQQGQGQRGLTARHIVALLGASGAGVVGIAATRSRRTRRLAVVAGAGAYLGAAVASYRSSVRLRRTRPDIDGPGLHALAPLLAPPLAVLLDTAWVVGLVRGARR